MRREVLAEINEFEPFALYNTITKGAKARSDEMTSESLRSFLRDNHVQSINSILPQEFGELLSNQTRTLNPNQITYSEFLRIILPIRRKNLREKVLKR